MSKKQLYSRSVEELGKTMLDGTVITPEDVFETEASMAVFADPKSLSVLRGRCRWFETGWCGNHHCRFLHLREFSRGTVRVMGQAFTHDLSPDDASVSHTAGWHSARLQLERFGEASICLCKNYPHCRLDAVCGYAHHTLRQAPTAAVPKVPVAVSKVPVTDKSWQLVEKRKPLPQRPKITEEPKPAVVKRAPKTRPPPVQISVEEAMERHTEEIIVYNLTDILGYPVFAGDNEESAAVPFPPAVAQSSVGWHAVGAEVLGDKPQFADVEHPALFVDVHFEATDPWCSDACGVRRFEHLVFYIKAHFHCLLAARKVMAYKAAGADGTLLGLMFNPSLSWKLDTNVPVLILLTRDAEGRMCLRCCKPAVYFFDAQFLSGLLHDPAASTVYPPKAKAGAAHTAAQLAALPEPMRFVWGSFNPYATLNVEGMPTEMHPELQAAFLQCTQEPHLAVAYFESADHFLLPLQPDDAQAGVVLVLQNAKANECTAIKVLSREQAFVAARVSHPRLTHSWVSQSVVVKTFA